MSRSRFRAYPVKGPRTEAGAALLAFLLVLLVGGSYALLGDAKSLAQRAKLEEARRTSVALAEAKTALIGYAASADIIPTGACAVTANGPRPGDLPCPDQDNDGDAESSCADPSPFSTTATACAKTTGPTGTACRRLGRLPWKTLGLPDLRDGSGERLWYAVSTNFKKNPRTLCGSSGLPGCLNSDSRGTITIWDPSHTVRHHAGDNPDPYVPSGAVAVIIAPGPALRRQGGLDQDRGCTVGVDCDSNDICTQPTLTTTPKCRAVNFLDGTTDEDNQQFIDGNNNNGFIQGDVFDVAENVTVNDRVLPVTYNDIMPLLERRVVGEVLTCLKEYANPTGPNHQRYPWAAKLGSSGSAPEYSDDSGYLFGRLPDGQPTGVGPRLDDTKTAIGSDAWDYWPNKGLVPNSNCKLTSVVSPVTWWLNWKEHVFYSVASGFQPAPTPPSCGPPPNNCLIVNPPSLVRDREVIVIAAGKRLRAVASGQPRTPANKADISNYLEGQNADYVDDGIVDPNEQVFTSGAGSQTFNDVVCKQGIC